MSTFGGIFLALLCGFLIGFELGKEVVARKVRAVIQDLIDNLKAQVELEKNRRNAYEQGNQNS